MKIKDILSRVRKEKQFESYVEVRTFIEDMQLNINYYGDCDRLTSYYFVHWYCTDSWVGQKVYFLDDIPVAISSQSGRKCDEEIEWISKDTYNKVKEYILSLEIEEEPNITMCDLEEEIGDTYKIQYHSQLFDYHKKIALYHGENVNITKYHKGLNYNKNKQYEPSLVEIKLKDNTTKWVDVDELDFPFNIE